MIHAGFGYSQICNFLSECNMPFMSKTTLHRHEKKIGRYLQEISKTSCEEAQCLEKELSKDTEAEVSFDGGFQKRGTGLNYNSLTGHASLIGSKSGKVLCFDVRSKSCKVCEHHERRKETVPPHECCRNWTGPSKSMEPEMVVSMVHKVEEDSFPVNVVHADNDSTTTMKLKLDFPDLKKKDDHNHIKKGMTKSILDLAKRLKNFLEMLSIKDCVNLYFRHKELSGDAVPYLVRCLMYAVTSNKDDPAKLNEALSRIVPHVFGDHSLCEGVDWCKYKENPLAFRYKSLPGGKPLQSNSLKLDLQEIVEKYMERSSQLTNLVSTQQNENFNQIVATKAPKSKHYGGSQSLLNRVAASVLQKNEGFSYLEQVNRAASLSPGFFTHKTSQKIDMIKEKRRRKQRMVDFKRRRLQLKKQRKERERKSCINESVSYKPCLETSNVEPDDHLNIPTPPNLNGNESFVIFDIETTGLGRTSDITQIAASCGEQEYQCYVLPRCAISTEASKIT